MIRYRLPISEDANTSLARWGSELRAKFPLEAEDFVFKDYPLEVRPGGTMTAVGGSASDSLRFCQLGNFVFVYGHFLRTLGGVASPIVTVILPTPVGETSYPCLPGTVSNGVTGVTASGVILPGTKQLQLRRYDGANYNLVLTEWWFNGFYEAA